MSEKKSIKKQVRDCKRKIKRSNSYVRGFMRSQDYRPGSYQMLQKTKIWSIAKNQLIYYHDLKYNQLICLNCGQEIRSNPVLHHKKYNWNKLFNPKYVGFAHQKCHLQIHSTKRGYKRILSYYQTKMLILVIGVILLLIFFLL